MVYARFLYFRVFLFLGIERFVETIKNARDKSSRVGWIDVVFYGLLVLLCLVVAVDLIFKRYWKSGLEISRIAAIKISADEAGLETNVVLMVQSGRYKHLRFRTLEKQFDGLIETIRSVNPNVIVHQTGNTGTIVPA
jgi:hypothetical protein